jgi:ubiquinone/menaquinone biosynthesis C-methylase UbiE
VSLRAQNLTLTLNHDELDNWTELELAKEFEPELSFVLDERSGSSARALDAGSGPGKLCLALAPHTSLVVGMDISHEELKRAREAHLRRGVSNTVFVVGDLNKLPFRPGTFDMALSRFAYHHTDLEVSLPEMRRVVAPRGRVFLRDFVARFPRMQKYAWWHALLALPRAARLVLLRGPWAGVQCLRVRLSRRSLHHQTVVNRIQSPEVYREAHRRNLPGCNFPPTRPFLFFIQNPVVTWRASDCENAAAESHSS